VRACLAVATMGYAIPGTVLALGLLSPLVAVDESVNWLSMRVSGTHVGLLLAGSSAALIVAYAARFHRICASRIDATMPDEATEGARCGPARAFLKTAARSDICTPAALLIVAVGILPIIWIVRQAEMSPHSGGNRENPDRTLRTRKSRRTRSPFQR
jgi:hypothetical protein